MNDLTEAGKFPSWLGKADKAGDVARDTQAGASVADDAGYVMNRLFGKKEPKANAASVDRVEPELGFDVPPPVAPKKAKPRTDTNASAAAELDDIRKLANVDFPKKTRTKTNAPKAKAEPEAKVAPTKVEEPPVVDPNIGAKTDTTNPGDWAADARGASAADHATPAEIKSTGRDTSYVDDLPRADPEAVVAQAEKEAQRIKSGNDADEIERLRQELKAMQDASAPPPPPTPAEQLRQAMADLENAKTQKQIRDAQAEITRLNAVEPPAVANTTNTTPPANNATSDKIVGDLKDIAGTAWDVAKKPLGWGAGVGAANYGIDMATGIDPINLVSTAIKNKNERDAAAKNPAPIKTTPEKSAEPVDNSLPELKDSIDFRDILKLAGLKPITERDITSGLTKAKPIMTLVENKNLSECGMGMSSMTPNTPASLSINATAGSGEEVASMLASILQLAGLKQVDASMMPEVEPMPMMKAMDIMTANPSDEMDMEDPMVDGAIEIDVMPDSMNSGADDGMSHDEEEKTEEGFEDATTKPNPTAMPGYGSWEQKFQRLSGDEMANVPARSGDNPLKRSPAVKESVAEVDPVTLGLFKAYEAFKNGQ